MKIKETEIILRHSGESKPVKIVADAMVTTGGLQGGRYLPVLLLDTSERPDISELTRVHQSLGPGDVRVAWGQLPGRKGTVALYLWFVRPVELFLLFEFDIVRQGILVELALGGKAIYIAEAKGSGDRLMKNFDRPKVIVDIPDTGFQKTWDVEFHKYLSKDFRAKGLSRSDSKRAATSVIAELREFRDFRMADVFE